ESRSRRARLARRAASARPPVAAMRVISVARSRGAPYGTRTRVSAVKGRCPRPLDEGRAGRGRDIESFGGSGKQTGKRAHTTECLRPAVRSGLEENDRGAP